MRFLVNFSIIFFTSLPYVLANETPTPTTISAMPSSLASKSLLLDIAVVGDSQLVAVGHHGHIITSNDGEHWQQANVPVQTTLTSVYFVNEQLGWAVGHDATILHSKDGGLNWQIQQFLPALEKPLLDVYFENAQQGIAIGAYGQFFRTLNGGKTWQSEFHQEFLIEDDIEYLNELKAEDDEAYLDEVAFILPHFNRIVVQGQNLFLMGEIGLLAQSDNFGKHWQQFDNFYQGSFFASTPTENGRLLVAGLRGHVFLSGENILGEHAASTSWNEVSTDTTALLNDIILSDDGRIFILGNNGMLLVSTDDGKSFIQKPQPDGKSLIAGVWYKGSLVTVSDVGIKLLSL